MIVISDGVLPLPTKMLGHNVTSSTREAWLDRMFLPRGAFDWALNVVLVHSGDQTVLIDAGLRLDPDLNLPRAGQLTKRLASAGIDLGSVTDVCLPICTWITLAVCWSKVSKISSDRICGSM